MIRGSPRTCVSSCTGTVLTVQFGPHWLQWVMPLSQVEQPVAHWFLLSKITVLVSMWSKMQEWDQLLAVCSQCACPTHFIHLVPPHSTLLWLQPTRLSRTTPVFLCSFGLNKQNGGSMYGETEHLKRKCELLMAM